MSEAERGTQRERARLKRADMSEAIRERIATWAYDYALSILPSLEI